MNGLFEFETFPSAICTLDTTHYMRLAGNKCEHHPLRPASATQSSSAGVKNKERARYCG